MQFIYENDEKTKMFGHDQHQDGKVLDVPIDTRIGAVSIRHTHHWCKGLKFFDDEGNEIVEHTWMGHGDMGHWSEP